MPVTSIIVVGVALSAFTAFALALALGGTILYTRGGSGGERS